MPNATVERLTNGNATARVTVAIVGVNVFGSVTLEHTLRFHGITTMARSDDPGTAPEIATASVDTLLWFAAIEDEVFDLTELQTVRAVRPTIGLVVLTLARDIRLLGIAPASLPIGTRVISVHDEGGTTRLAATIRSAARHPLAVQRPMTSRIPLSGEQIVALRAVAAGLDNKELAAERSTTVSAARQLVNRTARSLGIPPTASPSQQRALMGAIFVRLLGGAAFPRRGLDATLTSTAS
jgi:DNA-binding NarL/FixJ family response regulator